MRFYKQFKQQVNEKIEGLVPAVPDIGDSIFKASYLMVVFYIAWFQVLGEMGISVMQANVIIWETTENSLKRIHNTFMPLAKRMYLNPMIKKAESHAMKSKENNLPEFDWKIEYRKIDENCFCLDTYECGVKKLCEHFGVGEMLPSLCRMDYLTSHYMKCGFERTKTLADGDGVCNNKFYINGDCEWSPEKGFEGRK